MVCNRANQAFVSSFSLKEPKGSKSRRPAQAKATVAKEQSNGHVTASAEGAITAQHGLSEGGPSYTTVAHDLNALSSTQYTPTPVAALGTAVPDRPDAATNKRIADHLATIDDGAEVSKRRRLSQTLDPSLTEHATSSQTPAPTPKFVGFVMESPSLGASQSGSRRSSKQPTDGEAKGKPGSRRASVASPTKKRKSVSDTPKSAKVRRSGKDEDAAAASHKRTAAASAAKTATAVPNANSRNKPGTLRMNKPVKADVHNDIWREIMKFSTPRTLLNLRMINQHFRQELHDSSHLWSLSRHNAYGDQAPPCPPELNEREYCNLLEGFGCQSPGCQDRRPRKVYWLFMCRLCETCIQGRLRSYRSLSTLAQGYGDEVRRLLNNLPSCSLDAWGKYGSIGAGMSGWDHRGYDVRVFTKRYNELQEMLGRGATDEEKAAWFNDLDWEKREKLARLRDLEDFSKQLKEMRRSDNREVKAQREQYFKDRAAEMDPPLAPEALEKIDAYKSAIKTGRPPTETCWQALKPKLEQQRVWAEKIIRDDATVADERRIRSLPGFGQDAGDPFRSGDAIGPPPKHILLAEIAAQVAREPDVRDLSPTDFVATIFVRAHERYLVSTDPRKGPLFMSDTEWLLSEQLEEIVGQRAVAQLNDPSAAVAATFGEASRFLEKARFRCPGCAHKLHGSERSWSALLTHIVAAHADSTVGDFHRWRVSPEHSLASKQQALRDQPWPRNLPLLGRDQPATGRWNLDAAPDYRVAAPAAPEPAPPAVDPFADRAPSAAPLRVSFVEDVLHALERFDGSRLDTKLQSHVAFEFGLQRFDPHHPHPDDLDGGGAGVAAPTPDPGAAPGAAAALASQAVARLHARLLRAGRHTAFEGLSCGFCAGAREGDEAAGEVAGHAARERRGGRKAMELGNLLDHFQSRYDHPAADWTTHLFRFPGNAALAAGLAENAKAREAFEELFPKVQQAGLA